MSIHDIPDTITLGGGITVPVLKDSLPVARTRRLDVTVSQLAETLGMPEALITAYLKHRELHECTPDEKRAGCGLCSEEIAAMQLSMWLVQEYKMPILRAVELLPDLIRELFDAIPPIRVILAIFKANRRLEVRITSNYGEIHVPEEIRPQMRMFDATLLAGEVEAILGGSKLKLPPIAHCVVAR